MYKLARLDFMEVKAVSKIKYIKKTTKAGDTIEVEKTQSARYLRAITRGGNEKQTPKDVQEVNKRNAEKNLTRTLNANFHPGDYHMVLTYEDDSLPKTAEEAKRYLDGFLRDMRGYYAAQNAKFAYVAVTEGLARRIHHHMVVKKVDIDVLTERWPYGRVRVYPLDSPREYSKLAAYLIKETDRTFREAR